MTTINNSLLAQMQSMSLEAIAKPQNNDNIVNNTTNNFGDLLSNALNTVNDLHKDAGKKTTAFELGDRSVTLADVMIARSKAGIGSDAAIQIRNKAIEGYKEIMSMPV
ncbi:MULTISPECIES: flagellar hook-basal body complex protein FliE [Colwellia]|jgi:flagellar hook-basal body complex protein FliE|tara:strand:- start:3895 stop:4218 length:324 start_codon:yes stop_codon:yes gene_type:complete